MFGLLPLVSMLALGVGTAAGYAENAAPTPPPQASSAGEAQDTLLVLFERDPQDRMTVPVKVGGTDEELRFLVDTGAEHSAISVELAQQLALEQAPARRVVSFGGERVIPAVRVDSMSFSDQEVEDVNALTLSRGALGSDGLIGIDQLALQLVTFDFENGEMQLRPSPYRSKRERRDAVSVDLKEKQGRLVVGHAKLGSRRIDMILDTGSSITIGNAALARTLGADDLADFLDLQMLTVTGDLVQIRYGEIEDVRIGSMKFDTLPVAFAEAEPFDRLGFTKRPAIILGMDVLRSFGTMTIDFRRREAKFTAREGKALQPRDYWGIGSVSRQGTPRGRLGGN